MHWSSLHTLPALLGVALLPSVMASADASAFEPVSPERLALRALAHEASAGNAEALRRLAYVHEIGFDSIAPDTVEATRLYGEAARAGDVAAQSLYGFRLMRGEGTAPDTLGAIAWITRAADGGDARAANNLGWIYASGTGLEKDSAAAAGWYLRAAGEGLPAGAWNLVALLEEQPSLQPADSVIAPVYRLLGESFSRGQGVPYSYRRSLEYYLRGAAYGDERSELVLTELLGQMPDALTILPLDSLSAAWGRPLPLP